MKFTEGQGIDYWYNDDNKILFYCVKNCTTVIVFYS